MRNSEHHPPALDVLWKTIHQALTLFPDRITSDKMIPSYNQNVKYRFTMAPGPIQRVPGRIQARDPVLIYPLELHRRPIPIPQR
jgi:hypothetical protein